MDHDYELEKQNHPENFEPYSSDDYKEEVENLNKNCRPIDEF
jgi:hypothetical protein